MPTSPSIHISIHNRQTVCPIDLVALEDRLRIAIAAEEPASADISIIMVDDAEIHRLNREFLNHDWPTDVITFFEDVPESAPFSETLRGRQRSITGELVVSVETALREAQQQQWGVDDELLLYCVHGWLHLCGYDDLTDDERPLMRQR
jgi:probable rRNA maturation factor